MVFEWICKKFPVDYVYITDFNVKSVKFKWVRQIDRVIKGTIIAPVERQATKLVELWV